MYEVILKIKGIKGVFKTLHTSRAKAIAYARGLGGEVFVQPLV